MRTLLLIGILMIIVVSCKKKQTIDIVKTQGGYDVKLKGDLRSVMPDSAIDVVFYVFGDGKTDSITAIARADSLNAGLLHLTTSEQLPDDITLYRRMAVRSKVTSDCRGTCDMQGFERWTYFGPEGCYCF